VRRGKRGHTTPTTIRCVRKSSAEDSVVLSVLSAMERNDLVLVYKYSEINRTKSDECKIFMIGEDMKRDKE
jgi:hypothetical protein